MSANVSLSAPSDTFRLLTAKRVFFHRISELIERETGEYYKSDPDPFDDRHPGSHPAPTVCFHLICLCLSAVVELF